MPSKECKFCCKQGDYKCPCPAAKMERLTSLYITIADSLLRSKSDPRLNDESKVKVAAMLCEQLKEILEEMFHQ